MMVRLVSGLLAATLLSGATMLTAAAGPITETFDFTAKGFQDLNLNPGPVDPWKGQFTITFDPNGGHQSGALDSFSSNFTVGIAGSANWVFVYSPFILTIGDDCGANGCAIATGAPGSAQLDFGVDPTTGADAIYSASNDIFESTKVSGTSTIALPEPNSLLLLVVGLVGMAALRRRLTVSRPAPSYL